MVTIWINSNVERIWRNTFSFVYSRRFNGKRWYVSVSIENRIMGQFSCLSFINHVITNAYYVIISFCFLFPCSNFFLFPAVLIGTFTWAAHLANFWKSPCSFLAGRSFSHSFTCAYEYYIFVARHNHRTQNTTPNRGS